MSSVKDRCDDGATVARLPDSSGEAPASRRRTSVGSFPSWQKAFIVSRSFCRQGIGAECFLQLTAGLE